ncbi:MAG: sulfatase-like hydrolase/transferase [Lentisphaerae bacterium]|nr:sulfatase-like hydrolase/transferase [Lentisphaerota bacterium]
MSNTDRKTNILFITTDQQHWQAMGYLNPEVQTPNLDRLVRGGTTFHRAYTVNPTCTPTRASWITGLYPSQHGAYSLGTKLMENVPTVGDIFRKHGYRTALIGKAHFQPLKSTPEYPSLESYPIMHDLDFWRKFTGPFYGFERAELARNHTHEAHIGQHYALWLEERAPGKWRDYFAPTPEHISEHPDFPRSRRPQQKPPPHTWDIPEELHYNTWIAERTNALMSEYAGKNENFFLWASFLDPHPPYMIQTKPDFEDFLEPDGHGLHGSGSHLRSHELKARNIATMYGMITMMDKYIGKILDQLDHLGLTENTVVCFTTDHGDFLGQHGLVAKAIHHYEDLLRVPLVVSQPGTIPAGRVSDSLQSTVDLAQTFLSLAGLPLPRTMAGVDQNKVWTGQADTLRDHVLVENQHQPTTMNMRTFINQRYKLTVHFNRDYGELYDLEQDPGEYVNLWNDPAQAGLKSNLLLEFMYAEMARTPLPMPRITSA